MSLQCTNLVAASDQYFSISDANQVGLNLTGDLTFLFAFNFATAPSNEKYGFINKWGDAGNRSYILDYRDNGGTKTIRFITNNNGSTTENREIAYTLPIGEWKWLAVTFDASASQTEYYLIDLDGNITNIGSNTGSQTSIYDSAADVRIGAEGGTISETFNGKIAYGRVWNAILTESQIQTETQSLSAVTTSGNQADWRFNSDATDDSANGNDLIANNSPTYVNDNPLTDISLYGTTEGTNYVVMTANSSEVDNNITNDFLPLDLSQISASDNFWSTVLSTGADIRVFDSTGTTQFPLYIKEITTGSNTGVIYFKPTTTISSSADTDIRIYYNGTSGKREKDALYGQYEVMSTTRFFFDGKNAENITDGQTLSTSGGVTIGGSTGLLGSTTDFDGTDDVIFLNDTDVVNVGTEDFALLSIINPDVTGTFMPYFNAGRRTGTSESYGIDLLNSDTFGAIIQEGVSGFVNPSGGTYSSATNYFHATNFDRSADAELFVDGSSITTASITGESGAITPEYGLTIGCRRSASITDYNSFYNGQLEVAVIFNKIIDSGYLTTFESSYRTPGTFWTYNAPNNFIPRVTMFM